MSEITNNKLPKNIETVANFICWYLLDLRAKYKAETDIKDNAVE
jgi:hypothetical protein